MTIDHRTIPARLTALLVAVALLTCCVLVARADAAPAIDPPTPPTAGQVLLNTDAFQVRPTSDTTAELVGQGADTGLGHVRVQLVDGTVGTTPVAFWAELWNWLKSHVSVNYSGGCFTISASVPIGIGRYKTTFKPSLTLCS